MLRKRQRTTQRIATIDMTGLAAIMLALVALFAIPGGVFAHRYRHPSGVSVDLPRVSQATPMRGALKEDALFVAVTRDGSIFFNQDRVKAPGLLPARIRELLDQGAERKIYLQVDAPAATAPFGKRWTRLVQPASRTSLSWSRDRNRKAGFRNQFVL